MRDTFVERIKSLSFPLSPIPTNIDEKIDIDAAPRAVLFDIYGTLFISASGDIGVLKGLNNEKALEKAMQSSGIKIIDSKAITEGIKLFNSEIEKSHNEARRRGVEYPEIIITDIWERVIQRLSEERKIAITGEKTNGLLLERLAIEYEFRINPVWPMPQATELLVKLKQHGIVMGIISNAQFYTEIMFEALTGKSVAQLGFDTDLIFWSYMYQEAKPSLNLFKLAEENLLKKYGIKSSETLYAGNDMLNDIYPAASLGFMTALFAGDRRSLRFRENDERCKNISPDIIFKSLERLKEIF